MSDDAVAPTKAQAAPQNDVNAFNRSKRRLAWLLLTPTLIIVALVAIYPLAQTFYQSFTNARMARPGAEFVGFKNYTDLFGNDAFRRAIWNTISFTLITVTFEFVLGMIIALVINSNFRGRGVMRAAMLVPWAIPTVIAAQIWAFMLNDQYGVINDLLFDKLHVISEPIAWLANTNTKPLAVAAVDIWKTTPFMALLLLAGLQVIPSDIYEAARVDGANAAQQFWRLTLPLLKPAIMVALIFRTLDALRVFDVFYVFFKSDPKMQTMATYAQKQLVDLSKLGFGSAVSITIFLIIAVFVAVYVTVFKVEEA